MPITESYDFYLQNGILILHYILHTIYLLDSKHMARLESIYVLQMGNIFVYVAKALYSFRKVDG